MAKVSKTADELRDMILERVQGNRICPPGMMVQVRQVRMSWGIDCLPPTTNKEAHADCCALLTRIATELREEYDLRKSD
jgi:hypothetical protein